MWRYVTEKGEKEIENEEARGQEQANLDEEFQVLDVRDLSGENLEQRQTTFPRLQRSLK